MPAYDSGVKVVFGWNPKRYNSTNRWFHKEFSAQCRLKNNTDITHPVFMVSRNALTQETNSKATWVANFAEINYCYVGDFLRYYWVDKVEYSKNDFVYLYCSSDVLASHFALLESIPGFLTYTSYKKVANGGLDDARLQPEIATNMLYTTAVSRTGTVGGNAHTYWDIDNGVFVVDCTVLGVSGGMNCTYVLDQTNFLNMGLNLLCQIIIGGDGVLNKLETFLMQLWGGQGNPNDYVHNVRWVPIPYSEYKSYVAEGTVALGGVELTAISGTVDNVSYSAPAVTGKLYLDHFILGQNKDVTLPVGNTALIPTSKATSIDEMYKPYFTRGSKYTKWCLVHPGGVDWFECNAFCNPALDLEVNVFWYCDTITGDYTVKIYYMGMQAPICTASGNMAIEVGNLFTGGGQAQAAMNAASSIAKLGFSGASAIFNAKLNPRVIQKNVKTKSDEVVEGEHNYVSNKTVTDRSIITEPQQFDLGTFGNFFPGGMSISTGGNSISNSNKINVFSCCQKIVSDGENGYAWQEDQGSMFTIYGMTMLPSVIFRQQYDEYAKHHGYPSGKWISSIHDEANITPVSTIGEGSYIQFSGADAYASGAAGHCMLPDEISQMNTFLNSGFYYEDGEMKPPSP